MNQIDAKLIQSKKFQHHENKKQLLEFEINECKKKMSKYEQIQKYMMEISHDIEQKYKNQSQMKSSIKSGGSKEKSYIDKSVKAKNNSNKKIKIYELQKKLNRINKEYSEKEEIYSQKQLNKNMLQSQIVKITDQINQQKNQKDQLKKLMQQIDTQVQIVEKEKEKEMSEMEKADKYRKLFEFENRRIKDQISKTKQEILCLKNQNQGYADSSMNNSKVISELPIKSNKQNNMLSINLEQNETSELSAWLNKETEVIHNLFDKLQVYEEEKEIMSKKFYDLRQKIDSYQSLSKHHSVTNNVMSHHIQFYQGKTQQTKRKILQGNQLLILRNKKLQDMEGERGEIRGKIGVKIEEQKLAKLVNNLIKCDLQKLKQKLSSLILIKKVLQKKIDYTISVN